MRSSHNDIYLVGPGGAGKSTVGVLLAERLGLTFIDLDRSFTERHGDISEYLNRSGYDAYAKQNIEVYRSLSRDASAVIALSSGFMTYRDDVHPSYAEIRASIAICPATFVLLPSFDLETCVAEIVRRQVQRPFGPVASREETKIRMRFRIFMSLPAQKIETMRPPHQIVAEIMSHATRCLRSNPSSTDEHFPCYVSDWHITIVTDLKIFQPRFVNQPL